MNVYENMCTICGKALSEHDEYFAFTDALFSNANEIVVCDDCAVKTTVYDLYNRSALTMANSLDDVIEADAVVSDDENTATPEEVEKFFTSSDPAFNPSESEDDPFYFVPDNLERISTSPEPDFTPEKTATPGEVIVDDIPESNGWSHIVV